MKKGRLTPIISPSGGWNPPAKSPPPPPPVAPPSIENVLANVSDEALTAEVLRRLKKAEEDRAQVELYEAENYNRQMSGES